jgi:hypothetical protein
MGVIRMTRQFLMSGDTRSKVPLGTGPSMKDNPPLNMSLPLKGEAIDPCMSSEHPLFSGMVSNTGQNAVSQARFDGEEQQITPINILPEQRADEEVAQEVAEEAEVFKMGWTGTEQTNLKKWVFTLTPGSTENEIMMNNFLEFMQNDLLKAVIGIEGGDEVVRERHFHDCLWFKYELENLFVLKRLFEEANFKPKEGKSCVYLHITEIRNWTKAVRYTTKGSVFWSCATMLLLNLKETN